LPPSKTRWTRSKGFVMQYINVMVANGYLQYEDRFRLFPENEAVVTISPLTNLQMLLVELGAFESKGQAKKNFKHQVIQDGWSHYVIGKMRRELCIWNPTE
jgi:hypothetical protein